MNTTAERHTATRKIVKAFYEDPESGAEWSYPMRSFQSEYGLPMSEFRVARVYFRPGAPVLDIGCGAGREVLSLAEAGFEAVGIDASLQMASLARANLGDDGAFRVVVAEAAQLPVKSGVAFNAMMAGGVIHSIAGARNRLAALQELRRVLHPAGAALVHYWRVPLVPELQSLVAPLCLARTVRLLVGAIIAMLGSCTNAWRRISGAFGRFSPEPGDAVFPRGRRLTYRHHYTRGGLERDLRAAGFESVTYVPSTPMTFDPVQTGRGVRRSTREKARQAFSRWLNGESGYFVCRGSGIRG